MNQIDQEEVMRSRLALFRSRSLDFFWASWTGRILMINAIVFVSMCFFDGSFFVPSEASMIAFGAKYSHGLIRGEYWRLVTPMFVHIGAIHFGLNSLALFYIGKNIEIQLGGKWFLFIYLLSGIFAGVCSGALTMGMSAGASGAIFGLLGVGFLFERFYMRQVKLTEGRRLRKGPYTSLVVVNVILGLILTSGPVRIDNAAHLGGLFAGCWLTYAFLCFIPNGFLRQNQRRFYGLVMAYVLMVLLLSWLATSATMVAAKYDLALNFQKKPQAQYEIYSEAIKTFPENLDYHFERGKLLMVDGQFAQAVKDFASIVEDPDYREKLEILLEEYLAANRSKEAEALGAFLINGQ